MTPAQPFGDALVEVYDGGVESPASQDMIGLRASSAKALEGSASTVLEEEEHLIRDTRNEASAHEEGKEVEEDHEASSTEEDEVVQVEDGEVDEDEEDSATEDDEGAPDGECDRESQGQQEDEWEPREWELRVGELLPIIRSLEPGALIQISLSGLFTSDISELVNALAREDLEVWGEPHHGTLYAGNPGDYFDDSVDDESFGNQGDYGDESEDERDFANHGDYVDERGFQQLLQEMIDHDDSQKGAPPAARTAVDCLLSILIQQRHLEDDGLAACAVCIVKFVLGEPAKQLPCLHHYHEGCLLPWLRARNSCPICRYELPTDDDDYEEKKRIRNVPVISVRNTASPSPNLGAQIDFLGSF